MRYYNKSFPFYCGIDLHTKWMYVCILDSDGEIVYHKNHKARTDVLAKVLSPYMGQVVVAVECLFTWYWIADWCSDHDVEFVLGHALAMNALSGAKTKNDKIDSQKIARLLKGGMLPMSYVYPKSHRATRDLFMPTDEVCASSR